MLRTTTHEVLKLLSEKGLASCVIKSGVMWFEAADPKKLINILEEKKEKMLAILPELNRLKSSVTEKPRIEMYEGKEGLKTILNDIIESNCKEVLQLGSARIFEVLEFYFPHWIKSRVKHKIYTRILQEKTTFIKSLKEDDMTHFREIRYLPKDFRVNTHISIYGNKIAILTLKKENLIGVIISNFEIAETQRSLFETLWKLAKK
jgi:hypothetical protein